MCIPSNANLVTVSLAEVTAFHLKHCQIKPYHLNIKSSLSLKLSPKIFHLFKHFNKFFPKQNNYTNYYATDRI